MEGGDGDEKRGCKEGMDERRELTKGREGCKKGMKGGYKEIRESGGGG